MSAIDVLLPHFKDFTVSRGLNYHYYFSAPTTGRPTVLLVHGFPSLAVDWHPQIKYFKEKGYGLVVPDQLGYGGTDKPKESGAYVHSLLAKDMVDILDHEEATNVVAVGHDWGSKTVGILANLYSDRFIGFGFLAVGYLPPGSLDGGIEGLREQAIKTVGYEIFGYWEFFSAPDAPDVIKKHTESFTDLFYAKDGRLWRFNMCLEGAIRIFVESDTKTARVPSILEEQWEYRNKVFGKYGLDGPLTYYRINLNGETTEDDKQIPLDKYTINKPVFFGSAHKDVICVDWAHEAQTRKYCANVTVANFDTTHWVAAEASQGVNEALEKWIEGIVLA